MRAKPEQVAQLLQSVAEPGTTVQMVETHISWLFFTPLHVFKLKKPVRFDFLDYSTTARRHWACQEELRLNERLAPHVYEHLLALTETSDAELELNGDGPVVDWLVQMRRLPAENAVDLMLREHRLTATHVQRIAEHLATFYTSATRSSIGAEQYRSLLSRHIRANRASLLEKASTYAERLARIHEGQLRYLHFCSEVFDARVTNSHIVDGHGDLRPEHIFVDGEVFIIDCVEFAPEMRTVDVADELSFLTMECERLGDGGLGAAVTRAYQQSCKDEPSTLLLDFYRSYRAAVRAKVIALRAQQQGKASFDLADLDAYLNLAEVHAARLGPPAVFVICGLMGSGKSTLARAIQRRLECALLSTDRVRQESFGRGADAGYGEGHYTPQQKRQIYDELFRRTATVLANGGSAILDGTFLSLKTRKDARDLARRYQAAFVLVHCVCPRVIALARIHRRTNSHSASEARVEHYDAQWKDFEPPAAAEKASLVDTTLPIQEQIPLVFAAVSKPRDEV